MRVLTCFSLFYGRAQWHLCSFFSSFFRGLCEGRHSCLDNSVNLNLYTYLAKPKPSPAGASARRLRCTRGVTKLTLSPAGGATKAKPLTRRCFRKALAMHPQHPRSLCNYAYMLHVGKRDFAKAEELYKRALQVSLSPSLPPPPPYLPLPPSLLH